MAMDRLMDSIHVWFGGHALQDHSPRSPAGCPGSSIAKVENFDEVWVNSQVHGLVESPHQGVQMPTEAELSSLPGGGQCDMLLAPRKSAELLSRMASIFKSDPPVRCGQDRELVGLSCAYRATYKQLVFSPSAVATHLQLAHRFWTPLAKENVQQLVIPSGSRLIIVGDTHGQLEDVLWIFFKHGPPSATNQYLFNGDIVDRGGHALEILILLFAIKRDIPNAVHIQRGNHEDVQIGLQFGFRAELESKFLNHFGAIWNICNNIVFPLMPLASVVLGPLTGGRKFCVLHGGVPVDCPGQAGPVSLLEDLLHIDRVRPTLQGSKDLGGHILFNLVWADPADSQQSKHKVSQVGRGNRFVEAETNEFCKHNGVAFVVRSHEVPRSLRGAAATHNGKTYTIFSASNYMGTVGNRGGVFVCEVNKGLQLSEHWAPPWPELARIYEQSFASGSAERALVVRDWEAQYSIEPEGGSGNQDASPRSPPASAQSQAGADDQLNQFVIERICENKDQLFTAFGAIDTGSTGLVKKADWVQVMLKHLAPTCDQVLTPALLDRLARRWGIADLVGYVRFLHRFQIRGDNSSDNSDDQPDLLREVSTLRRRLVDAPFSHLEQLLDPDGDRSVSTSEFTAFLPHLGIDVTPLQAGVLYEMMSNFMQQNPLTLDSTVLCLAIMSRDPVPVNEWSPVAETIGSEIKKAGRSYAYVFRYWDTDRDGYLSLSELREGLQHLPATQSLPASGVSSFMSFIEGMGITNDRASIFEFVRAVAPREWALQLHQAMCKDLLKRVWICRPALHALLIKNDPRGTNRVSVGVLRSCLEEINLQLEVWGRPKLSGTQLEAICEIASRGQPWVAYEEFIRGLHVEDTGGTR